MAKHITLPQMNKIWKAAKAVFVAKEEGKGLSTNDFDDTAKTKLNDIETGAEKNIIKSVKVNGDPVDIAEDGSVNVVIEKVAIEEASDEDIDAILAGTYEQ